MNLEEFFDRAEKYDLYQLNYTNAGATQSIIGEIHYATLPEWISITTSTHDYKVLTGLGNSSRGEIWRTPHKTANDPSVENFGREVAGKFESAGDVLELIDADFATIFWAILTLRRVYGTDPKAWFVGSRVDGEPTKDSDLDIIVQAPPRRYKKGGEGAGIYFDKTPIDIDITEDEDGAIIRNFESQVRIQ